MYSLENFNCKKYDVGRFFDVEMSMSLVLRQDEEFKDLVDRELDLIIGKRRKYSISTKVSKESDIYLLTATDDVYLYYDKVDTIINEESGREEIDLEQYLISKGIMYKQLESKNYQREKNKKKSICYQAEINKYGQFSGSHSWLDIDVFSARAMLFPDACKLDDIDVTYVSYSSFDDDMVEDISNFTKEQHLWDQDKFREFFIKLSDCNGGSIEIQNGVIRFGGFVGGELEITRTFEDGKYVLNRTFKKYGGEDSGQTIKNLATVAYALMKASSLVACKNIEAKALMAGII